LEPRTGLVSLREKQEKMKLNLFILEKIKQSKNKETKTKKFNLKKIFNFKPKDEKTPSVTVSKPVPECGSIVVVRNDGATTTTKTKIENNTICETEIDLSKSCIELVIHKNDGTIRRKKYRDSPRKSRPTSCHIVSTRQNGSLSRPSRQVQRPASEYGYTVDYRKYRSFTESTAGSEIIDFDNLKGQRSNITLGSRILIQEKQTLLNANPDALKRHYSSPACRLENQNVSPIDSTTSSGYYSNDKICLSPPLPTPNEIRNLTRRITEIQSANSSKRFVRYNSLPNYRLNYIPETEEE